jgi:hypothetical protein
VYGLQLFGKAFQSGVVAQELAGPVAGAPVQHVVTQALHAVGHERDITLGVHAEMRARHVAIDDLGGRRRRDEHDESADADRDEGEGAESTLHTL